MRRRVFAVLVGGLMFTSGAAAPQAVADPCRWIAHDLPLPSSSTHARTNGSSENNRFIVGKATIRNYLDAGLIWDNGALSVMPSAGSPSAGVYPKDVNNSGVVVGRHDFVGLDARFAAFRYRNGAYEMLETPVGHSSQAIAINNGGDILGEVWINGRPDSHRVVVWPSSGPVKSFLYGEPIGISDDRRLVQLPQRDPTAYVIDIESGFQTELPGGLSPMVLDNDRVLHYSSGGLAEWTMDGERVATWAGGVRPYGRTSSGHVVFGTDLGGNAMLWQWGIRYAVDSEKQPSSFYYGDISDEGALIGTYENPDRTSHPARWFWCA